MGGSLGGVPQDRERAIEVYYMLARTWGPLACFSVACGSLRRKHETVGDLDIILISERFDTKLFVERAFELLGLFDPLTKKGKARKQTHFIVNDENDIEICYGQEYGLQVDLYFCPPKSVGTFMLFLTGSPAFNIWQRHIAIRRGLKLTQWTLEGVELSEFDERAICDALQMKLPMPEMRDASRRDEWEALLW